MIDLVTKAPAFILDHAPLIWAALVATALLAGLTAVTAAARRNRAGR